MYVASSPVFNESDSLSEEWVGDRLDWLGDFTILPGRCDEWC